MNVIDKYLENMKKKGKRSNRLINEASPYLLQHSYNPVNWYSWGDEAFEKSKEENKPVFLSIGYSTCHWCHVMAHESFEDEEVAKIMNEYFVNIKVDREDRPDIDGVYMKITQAMTGSGGWPLSLFLTPDLKPIYAGTYFPPTRHYNIPSFKDILYSVHNGWEKNRENIIKASSDIIDKLQVFESSDTETVSDNEILSAISLFRKIYDPKNGGFGGAPKFPQPAILRFILEESVLRKDKSLEIMAVNTLKRMSSGGIYDHLGGGFHRYSVDELWRISHFEKMLYDQALLIDVLTSAWILTKDPIFKRRVFHTVKYLQRDMLSQEGGFYSAEDADSKDPYKPKEKSEGAFYLWRYDEILEVLGEENGRSFCECYGVKIRGNAPEDPQNEFKNKSVLYLVEEEKSEQFLQEKEILFSVRSKRERPHLDDKILTDWNSLLIGSLSRAGAVFNEESFIDLAKGAAVFLWDNQFKENSLYHSYRKGKRSISGMLADYSFTALAFIRLYESTGDVLWLEKSEILASLAIDKFLDKTVGGFYEAESKKTALIMKVKENYDGALPSANGAMIEVLLKLGALLSREEYKKLAEKTLLSFGKDIKETPSASPVFLLSAERLIRGNEQIVIASEQEKISHDVIKKNITNPVIIYLEGEERRRWFEEKNDFLKSVLQQKGERTFYRCINFACDTPAFEY